MIYSKIENVYTFSHDRYYYYCKFSDVTKRNKFIINGSIFKSGIDRHRNFL